MNQLQNPNALSPFSFGHRLSVIATMKVFQPILLFAVFSQSVDAFPSGMCMKQRDECVRFDVN